MNVLIPIANGTEEMEAVIMIDTLRRAQWKVTIAGLTDGIIIASRGVMLKPTNTWSNVDPADFDMLLLPGGLGGTQALCDHPGILQAVRDFDAAGKWLGSICAAARVLDTAGILEGRRFTCYPGVEKEMSDSLTRSDDRVVVDGHLVTSQGPGTTFDFALKLIERAESKTLADTVRAGLLL